MARPAARLSKCVAIPAAHRDRLARTECASSLPVRVESAVLSPNAITIRIVSVCRYPKVAVPVYRALPLALTRPARSLLTARQVWSARSTPAALQEYVPHYV